MKIIGTVITAAIIVFSISAQAEQPNKEMDSSQCAFWKAKESGGIEYYLAECSRTPPICGGRVITQITPEGEILYFREEAVSCHPRSNQQK